MKIVFLDKYGWPVELLSGRPITNLIRLVLHTRKIVRGHWDGFKVEKAFAEKPKPEGGREG